MTNPHNDHYHYFMEFPSLDGYREMLLKDLPEKPREGILDIKTNKKVSIRCGTLFFGVSYRMKAQKQLRKLFNKKKVLPKRHKR
mmetsp:Transcript_33033/g.37502  ORF Transcript_33033/g.37502 Transcript_33033/m.37502 type:complete len:84 (+) Transcript_33033:125-376(+)